MASKPAVSLLTAVAMAILLGLVGAAWIERHTERPVDVVAACGFARLRLVRAGSQEHAAACAAIADVVDYFAAIGFRFAPEGTIDFGTPASEHGRDWLRSHGSFDARTLTVRVFAEKEVSAWGVTGAAELAPSFLRHEIVHLAVRLILGEQSTRVPRHWQEFVAYAIQIDLMPTSLRERILQAAPDAEAFSSLLYVNEFLYGFDPEAFALASYRTYLARGRGALVRQILSFELIVPDEILPASPILPGQVHRP